MSVKWQHCMDHAEKIRKSTDSPDCLLGVVTQPTDSRLSEIQIERDLCAFGSTEWGGGRGGGCPSSYNNTTGQTVAEASRITVIVT